MNSAGRTCCPNCGELLISTLACLECGRVLHEAADANHYTRLGMRPEDPVDKDATEVLYLRLSRALHPDFHGNADEAGLALANRNTALLNEAWGILDDAVARAEYRLGLLDSDALDKHKQLDPTFLMEAMEMSEEAESGDDVLRTQIGERVRGEIARRLQRLAEDAAWSPPDTAELAVLLHEMRVYKRILRDLEAA